jgi:hypothetical protein
MILAIESIIWYIKINKLLYSLFIATINAIEHNKMECFLTSLIYWNTVNKDNLY